MSDPLARLTPYELRHLVAHLLEHDRVLDIHRLLRLEAVSEAGRQNAWHAAKERAGAEAEYLAELALVLQAVERETQLALQNGTTAASVGLLVRYWLVGASLRTRRSNLPVEILAALVSSSDWTWARAEADASNRPSPAERAAALTAILPHAPQPAEKTRAIDAVLREIRQIRDSAARAGALTTLAPLLDDPIPRSILDEALAIVKTIDPDSEQYAIGLASVAARLPEPERTKQMKGALSQAGCMEYGSWRVTALRAIAPLVPETLLPQLLAVADQIDDESNRAEALEAVSPYLPEPLLQTAIRDLKYVASNDWRGRALAALEPLVLSPRNAIATIRSGKYGRWKGHALGSVAPRLPPDLLAEAYAELGSVQDHNGWDFAAARVLPRLPNEGEALRAVLIIASRPHRAMALELLAPRLSDRLLEQLLADVAGWEGRDVRRDALRTLAPHLAGPLLSRALDASRAIKDGVQHAKTIASLAPHLSEPIRTVMQSAALEALWTSDDRIGRPFALGELAAVLPGSLILTAWNSARNVEDEDERGTLVAALAPHLPDVEEAIAETERVDNSWTRQQCVEVLARRPDHQMAPRLLAMVASSIDSNTRSAVQSLCLLAPQLDPLQLNDAMAAAETIGNRVDRAVAVLTLATHVERGERQRIAQREYEVMQDGGSFQWPVKALVAAAPLLPKPIQREAIARAIARARSSADIFKVQELTACALLLPEEEKNGYLEEALTVLERLEGEWAASALTALAPHLPEPLIGRAVSVVETLLQGDRPDAALNGVAAIAPRLSHQPVLARLALVAAAAGDRRHDRDRMLRYVAALGPVLLSLGGIEGVAEIGEAVTDATRWWS